MIFSSVKEDETLFVPENFAWKAPFAQIPRYFLSNVLHDRAEYWSLPPNDKIIFPKKEAESRAYHMDYFYANKRQSQIGFTMR